MWYVQSEYCYSLTGTNNHTTFKFTYLLYSIVISSIKNVSYHHGQIMFQMIVILNKQSTVKSCKVTKRELSQPSSSVLHSITDLVIHHKWRSGEGKLSDKVCESVVAPASLRSDIWKHFSFPLSRNEKGEKLTDRQITVNRQCQCCARLSTSCHRNAHLKTVTVLQLCP